MVLARNYSLVALTLLLGCAGTPRQTEGPTTSLSRDVITAEEIDASQTYNAYDAVKKLRGNFLSYRGRTTLANTSSPYPIVYVDEQAYGPIASLRNIPANNVESIRLYRAWEAATRYGSGLMGGVIAVYTRQ
jgi:outer membrane receptor for ferrienterochelin and colicin